MNIISHMNQLSEWGAAWILWLLLGLSVTGIAVVLERAAVLILSRDRAALADDIASALRRGDLKTAKRRLDESPTFEARIAGAGLDASSAGAAEERMAAASALARLDMERHLAFLGTLGNNAPFVGLLGTVIGIVRAFQALSTSGGQVSAELLAEVGEALIATAVGLLVALPAVAFFNLFQRVIRARLTRGEALGGEVLAYLKGAHHGGVQAR